MCIRQCSGRGGGGWGGGGGGWGGWGVGGEMSAKYQPRFPPLGCSRAILADERLCNSRCFFTSTRGTFRQPAPHSCIFCVFVYINCICITRDLLPVCTPPHAFTVPEPPCHLYLRIIVFVCIFCPHPPLPCKWIMPQKVPCSICCISFICLTFLFFPPNFVCTLPKTNLHEIQNLPKYM